MVQFDAGTRGGRRGTAAGKANVGSLWFSDRLSRTHGGGAAPIHRRVRLGALLAATAATTAALLSAGGGGGSPQRISTESGAGTAPEAPAQVAAATPGPARPFATTVGVGLANGRTRIERSLGCAGGGDADYWHFSSEAALPPGVITGAQSALPGDVRVFADVHSPHHAIRTTPEPIPGPVDDSAFLLPGATRVALSNNRGTVKLALTSGTCDRGGQTVDFDGTTARTGDKPGAWTIVSSSGSYRSAAGSGDFDLEANVSPGADNPWKLVLRGGVGVLQPALAVNVVDTFWGRDGVDYVKRQLGVAYDVTNVGPGDSFGTFLQTASSPTPGASLIAIIVNGDNLLIDGNTPLGTFPRALGDLASGETARVVLKWQLPLPAGNPPCGLVILGCEIDTTLGFKLPDALDVAATPDPSFTLRAKAPDLPPPA